MHSSPPPPISFIVATGTLKAVWQVRAPELAWQLYEAVMALFWFLSDMSDIPSTRRDKTLVLTVRIKQTGHLLSCSSSMSAGTQINPSTEGMLMHIYLQHVRYNTLDWVEAVEL